VKARLFFLAVFLVVCVAPSAARADLVADVDSAVSIVERFTEIAENAIPPAVLRDARGLAILTMTKGGFIVSARGGTGLVIARTETGWSGPSAIGTGGLGVGFQAGLQVSEYVFILNTQDAINAFAKGGNVTLGANLSAAIGPVGRSAEAGIAPQAAIYTYARSQGIFAGVSLEGTVIGTRHQANEEYYGKALLPSDILAGDVKPPESAQKLISLLSKY
jgi:lipid-binding SYLF domain-containing protein